jgi:2-polyprenyl-6-methoxyphenol hydroxylase-like FAD-dependent oxidoreductase
MIFENPDVDVLSNADVCIVGAGPVGLALAFKCASQGLSVVVLESGSSESASSNDTALGAIEIVTPHHAAVELIRAQGIGGTSRLWAAAWRSTTSTSNGGTMCRSQAGRFRTPRSPLIMTKR